jgi:hypothetical protein
MEPVETGKYLPDWQPRELSEHILALDVLLGRCRDVWGVALL